MHYLNLWWILANQPNQVFFKTYHLKKKKKSLQNIQLDVTLSHKYSIPRWMWVKKLLTLNF